MDEFEEENIYQEEDEDEDDIPDYGQPPQELEEMEEMEIPIRTFDRPEYESIKNLSKTQLTDFMLNKTSPELMLECIKEDDNIRNNAAARRAAADIMTQSNLSEEIDEDLITDLDNNVIIPTTIRSKRSKRSKRRKKTSKNDVEKDKKKKKKKKKKKERKKKEESDSEDDNNSVIIKKSRKKRRIIIDDDESESEDEGDKAALIKIFQKTNDQLMKLDEKDPRITLLINKINRISTELREKYKVNPDMLGFGKNLSKNKNINTNKRNKDKKDPMYFGSPSSKLYGIQPAPSMYVGNNQMVWPINNPTIYHEPNLLNVKRSYRGPTGGNPLGPPIQNNSKFVKTQTKIAFGKSTKQTDRMKQLGKMYRNGEFGNMSWKSITKKYLKKRSTKKKRSISRKLKKRRKRSCSPKRKRKSVNYKKRRSITKRRNNKRSNYKRSSRRYNYDTNPLEIAYSGYPMY
jgi:hypothetical protein